MTLFVLLSVAAPAITAAAAEMPPGASSCSGCHPASASVQTPVTRLIGRPAAQTVAALQAFRTGQRPATVMDRIAKGFSEAEITTATESGTLVFRWSGDNGFSATETGAIVVE